MNYKVSVMEFVRLSSTGVNFMMQFSVELERLHYLFTKTFPQSESCTQNLNWVKNKEIIFSQTELSDREFLFPFIIIAVALDSLNTNSIT